MIQQLSHSYPITTLCALLDCPRSSYYYHAAPTDDVALQTAIEQIVIRWPFYRSRRVTAQLRREGWMVNSKVVRRLLHEFGQQMSLIMVICQSDSVFDHTNFPDR